MDYNCYCFGDDIMPVRIEDIEEIYFQFRKAQADYNNRGFRMPKDFEKHFSVKLTEPNKKKLTRITGYFKTKWNNIDPYEYFKCGFELLGKKFSYVKFLDEKILLLYIRRDKLKKREIRVKKENLFKSAKFVKKYIEKNGISNIREYINIKEGQHKIVIDHYLKNKIDASFLVFLIIRKGLRLTDSDRNLMPYIVENYRKIVEDLREKEMKDFCKKLGEKL